MKEKDNDSGGCGVILIVAFIVLVAVTHNLISQYILMCGGG